MTDAEFSQKSELDEAPILAKDSKSKTPFWMRVYAYPAGRGGHYYKLMWGCAGRIQGQCHINGGEISTPLVQQRKQMVEQAINRGDGLLEILKLISTWPSAKPGPKPF